MIIAVKYVIHIYYISFSWRIKLYNIIWIHASLRLNCLVIF